MIRKTITVSETNPRSCEEDAMKIPDWVKDEAAKCAKELVGNRYVDEYYRQIAADFLWLYEQGWKDAMKSRKKAA